MYLRQFSLQVGTAGSGLELSPNSAIMPKCTFHSYTHTKETPNHCQIRIYNLAAETVNQIQNEFVQVVISAGYIDSPFGVIFNGTIIQAKVGYEGMGGIDSYLELECADGNLSYSKAIIQTAAGKGSTYQSRYNLIMQYANNYGNTTSNSGGSQSTTGTTGSSVVTGGSTTQQVTMGYTDPLPQGTASRGRAYYGMWRDHMRDFAASVNMDWFIQNGQVILLGKNNVLPGASTGTLLTPTTGLIGYPEQTEQGIKIRSLLNPNLVPGGLVSIQNSAVLQNTVNTTVSGSSSNSAPNIQTPISGNGQYKIIFVEHYGDTRGNDWYSDLTCVAYGVTAPSSISSVAIGTSAAAVSAGYTAPY